MRTVEVDATALNCTLVSMAKLQSDDGDNQYLSIRSQLLSVRGDDFPKLPGLVSLRRDLDLSCFHSLGVDLFRVPKSNPIFQSAISLSNHFYVMRVDTSEIGFSATRMLPSNIPVQRLSEGLRRPEAPLLADAFVDVVTER